MQEIASSFVTAAAIGTVGTRNTCLRGTGHRPNTILSRRKQQIQLSG